MASEGDNNVPYEKGTDSKSGNPNSSPIPTAASGTSPLPHLMKPLDNWSVDEVAAWISSLGKDYAVYADTFRDNNIDGQMLASLTKDVIKSHIINPLHLEVIWNRLVLLKKKNEERIESNQVRVCWLVGLQMKVKYFVLKSEH